MSQNPTQSPMQPTSQDDAGTRLQIAGFGVRLAAYGLDVIPITLMVFAVFYQFLGFDDTFRRYLNRGGDNVEARAEFLVQRNQIRDLSFIVYVVYCAILEESALQGTIGKRLLGLRVTDSQGRSLTMGRSIGRNSAKVISYLPCGLGFLWALWSKRKRAWHDMIAGTLVVKSAGDRREGHSCTEDFEDVDGGPRIEQARRQVVAPHLRQNEEKDA